MTTNFSAFTVVLENDIREDDAEAIQTAMRLIRSVLSMTPIVADPSTWIAEERVRHDLRQQVIAVLWPKT